MKVAVVLLNWNNASDTLACVQSLLGLHYYDYQIIVCDNASSDGSMDRFLEWSGTKPSVAAQFAITSQSDFNEISDAFSKRVIWIQTGGNLGFAGGNNVGLRIALAKGGFDYFWLLNNDCVVDSGALAALINRVKDDSSIGICGAKIVYYHYPDRVQAYAGAIHNKWTGLAKYIGHFEDCGATHSQRDVEGALSYVCGASMFVSRKFLDSVGLMAEDYFLYYEEIDWAIRAKGRFSLAYAPDAVVYHKEGATIGSSSNTRKTSRLSDYYLYKNRLVFTAKFYPLALPSVWIVMALQALKRGVRGQGDRMLLIFKIMFGKGVFWQ